MAVIEAAGQKQKQALEPLPLTPQTESMVVYRAVRMKALTKRHMKKKYVPEGYTRGFNGLWPNIPCSNQDWQESPYFINAAALQRKTLFFVTQNGHFQKLAKHTTDRVLGYKCMQTPELRVHVYEKVVQYYFVRHLCQYTIPSFPTAATMALI